MVISPWPVEASAPSLGTKDQGPRTLSHTHPQQLLHRRQPIHHLSQAILKQKPHARLDRFLADGVQVRVLADQLLDLVVDDQELEDAAAAVVARAAALLAALAFLFLRVVVLLAVLARR